MQFHYFRKECVKFIHNPHLQATNNMPTCHCGAIESDHLIQSAPPQQPNTITEEPWDHHTYIKQYPTNAFGHIEFLGSSKSNKPAKYVRVSDTTDMESLEQLLISEWDLLRPHKPNLIISVVGGAKNFTLNGRRKQTFNGGLIKVWVC